ncbi:glycosyltransferase family 4 protein [Brevibacterium spongiae]|uniref:Glycosyltransferase family 4 protein n=1 Tax=Brevibacterium spongiae TaxID=2909672 RepID=A0ABY5SUA0_9MICO|nr:glycosyltransferase family 4 protein [Brevibacterium spongiae]UVI36676.1 glycosyltransferase family 4 protein [Brevibacterium spongiae]
MNLKFLAKQIGNAVITTAGHMNDDRVFFSMQLARRLPKSASHTVGRLLGKVPGAATGAASAWLLGQESRAKAIITAAEDEQPSRLLGEIALNLGMLNAADRIADSLDSAASLRSRIQWTEGNIDEAITVLPDGKRKRRLSAERKSMSPGWWPDTDSHLVARPAACTGLGAAASLHVLTNSLPHTRSGYAYRSHLILTTLKDAGHRVAATTRPSYPVTIGRLSGDMVETVDGVDYLRDVPLRPAATPTARLEEQAAWIANQALERQVDLLHTTTHYVNGLATGAAARAIGLPWVYEVRGVLEETWAAAGSTPAERTARRESQRFALMRSKEIEIASAADAVITLGETMREHLIAGGVPAESITLIPNSVSEAVVNTDTSRTPAETRTRLGLPEDGIWVGTAASIVGYEGLDDLVDAVALARRQGTDVRLLIAGDGVALPELRERAEALGDKAVFTGRVSQTQAIEHQLALDAIVVPRKDEPVCRLVTPIKPIEAMGLGRPVVISDLPALRELVPESAGLCTPPQEPQRLAEALSELACDDSARENYGQNGRAHVLATRRWKEIGRRYGQVYSRLMGADAQ